MARVRLCVQNIDGGVCCLLCLIAVGVPLFTIVSFAACQPVQVWELVSVWAELLIAARLESPLAGCWQWVPLPNSCSRHSTRWPLSPSPLVPLLQHQLREGALEGGDLPSPPHPLSTGTKVKLLFAGEWSWKAESAWFEWIYPLHPESR